MQIAIETTLRRGSIAVLSGQEVLRRSNLEPSVRTAAALGPELEATLRWCRESGRRLGFISVADGPGSFTGLRIAVTAAKTLGYALELPLVAVDSVAAVAASTFHDHPEVSSLLVALDAYRGQVFAGDFRRSDLLPAPDRCDATWTAHPDRVAVLTDREWAEKLAEVHPQQSLAGDANPFRSRAAERMSRRCDAVGVGLLGFRAAAVGHWADAMALVPRYLRPSAAEEKADSDRGG